jgi:hypothetical protein
MAGLAWPLRALPPGPGLMCAQIALGGGFYVLIVALFDVAGLRRAVAAKAGPMWLALMKKVGAKAL